MAELALALAALLWGLTFPLIHDAMQTTNAYWFVGIRFALAALVMLPLVIGQLHRTHRATFIGGLCIGLANSLAFLTNSLGLETLSGAKSAFLTAIYIAMVPFLAVMFRLNGLKISEFLGALVCLVGLVILTGAHLQQWSLGDSWTLLSAFFFALSLVILQKVSQYSQQWLLLTFYNILWSASLPLALAWYQNIPLVIDGQMAWISLLYCALFATVVTTLLQTRYQPATTAARAAIIFSLEPVFALLTDWLINHTQVTWHLWVGGLIILVSILIVELAGYYAPNRKSSLVP